MSRLLVALLTILLSPPVHATLVAVVPARDGLVIAADSRFTFMGAPCDGAFKIVEPAHPLHTVAFVTGDSIFVAPPAAGENPCRYLASAPRLLDVGAVVRAYLDRSGDDPARISMAGLASKCVRAVQGFQRAYPNALRGSGGGDILSVVVASYEPARHASTLRNFVVQVDAVTGRVEAARMSETTLSPRTPHGVWIYGETGYVNRAVYAGPGRQFLTPSTQDFLHTREPVGDVASTAAVAAAVNVVRAASRAAETVPPPSGIGGPVRIAVIGGNPHAEILPSANAQ